MNHRTIISLWPSIEAVARDLSISPNTVAGWRFRQSIPHRYWPELVASARKREISGVTLENLVLGNSRKAA
jgi:hypothetical protein